MKPGFHSERGFTLVEIMVVVAIMGILLAVAVPSVRDMMANQRIKSAAFQVITSSIFARSEAIKRGTTVAIKAVSSNDLSTGWCVQLGSTATCSSSSPSTLSLKIEKAQSNVTYAFITTAGPISFNRSGRLTDIVKVEITDSQLSSLKRCITVDQGGNAKSTVGGCPTS